MDRCDRCGAARATDASWCPICHTRQPDVDARALIGELQDTFRPARGLSIRDPLRRVREYSRIKPSATAIGWAAQFLATAVIAAFLIWRSVALFGTRRSPEFALILVEWAVDFGVCIPLLRWLWRRRRVL